MLNPTPPCCEAWPSWADTAAWYALVDDPTTLVMPHLAGTRYRFNYCPAAGQNAGRRWPLLHDHHHNGKQMTELSPAVQAVMLAATNGNTSVVNDPVFQQCIAAELEGSSDT